MEYFSMFWTLAVFAVILLVTRYVMRLARLPPGPWGIPFIGYAFFLDNARRAGHVSDLCKRYKTNILSMTIFGNTIIFLNDYETMKEAFQKRSDLVDRQEHEAFAIFDKDYAGVINTSGKVWKEQRRFVMFMLRDFGMGKFTSETCIQNEALTLIDIFKSHRQVAFAPNMSVNMAVSNIINSMVFGKRFDYDDEEFRKALYNINELIHQFSSPGVFYLLQTGWGRKILAGKYRTLQLHYNGFTKFVVRQIDEHKERFDGSVHDLIDGYLKEIEDGKDRSVFNEKNLQGVITDIFIAGSETTFTTLRWALLYIAAHPEIQEKVHAELKNVLGDRLPNMSDKRNTPYTEATLNEVQRLNTLVPFALAHSCLQNDIELEGYTIPRGTPVAGNLDAVHTDPRIWKDPDTFDPGHFLDEDGQVINQERLVQFSIGRRSCAGEALARMELYIFFASWVQMFRIELATDMPSLLGNNVGVYQPKPFEIRMVER